MTPTEPMEANATKMTEVRAAIRDHHFNLDLHQQAHGSAFQAIDKIMKALDMPYIQGDELRRRSGAEKPK